MRTTHIAGIGAGLICGAYLTGGVAHRYLMPERIEMVTGLTAPGGRPGFAFVFNRWAWWRLSGASTHNVKAALHDKHTEQQLRESINSGLAHSAHYCPDRWLLDQVATLPSDEVFVSGYCASQDELETAAGS